MHCRICGTDQKVKYYRRKGMSMCKECSAETPRKASYTNFNKKYWAEPAIVPDRVKREFYNDYKTSKHTVQEYIDVTSAWIFDD